MSSPTADRGPGRWPISSEGGWSPRWRRDGRELLYFNSTGVMGVEVEPSDAVFRSGVPRRLFDPPFPVEPGATFDVTRDGRRFLPLAPLEPPEPICVLVNRQPQGT